MDGWRCGNDDQGIAIGNIRGDMKASEEEPSVFERRGGWIEELIVTGSARLFVLGDEFDAQACLDGAGVAGVGEVGDDPGSGEEPKFSVWELKGSRVEPGVVCFEVWPGEDGLPSVEHAEGFGLYSSDGCEGSHSVLEAGDWDGDNAEAIFSQAGECLLINTGWEILVGAQGDPDRRACARDRHNAEFEPELVVRRLGGGDGGEKSQKGDGDEDSYVHGVLFDGIAVVDPVNEASDEPIISAVVVEDDARECQVVVFLGERASQFHGSGLDQGLEFLGEFGDGVFADRIFESDDEVVADIA